MLKFIDTKDFVYTSIIAIAFLFLFKNCKEKNRQIELGLYNEKVHQSQLKTYIDNYNREVTLRENILLNSTKDLKKAIRQRDSLSLLAKKFKKINTITEIKTITKIKKDTIFVKDSVLVDNEYYYLFENHNENYSLYATLTNDNLIVDSLDIPNIQTAVVGAYKPSLFGKSRLTTSVTNSNPLVQTMDLSTLQVEVPKKWYEKPFLPLAIGVIGGILIAK